MPEFWTFIAGLGLFLLGMMLLEEALGKLAGPSFKRFLREHTRHPLEAILVGILVTAILQSSSLVTLMLLALTGAGIMSLRNALGVVIGANLGTTFTGWIVTTLGFKLNFDQVALPLVGIGCLGYVFLDPGRRQRHAFTFLAGFGFLFLGLGHMKTSAEGLATLVDIATLAGYGLPVFVLFGFVLTAIIQSSSASMMITLAAVNAGIIDLTMAAGVVIGSDLGTTMTTVIGSLKGSPIKRQVALAHVLFNIMTAVMALIMVYPLLDLLVGTLGVDDPLYGTVAFHSSFNVIGIILFYPFLGRFAQFLEHRFVSREDHAAVFMHRVPVEEPDVFSEALERDLQLLNRYIIQYNLHALGLVRRLPPAARDLVEDNLRAWPGATQAYAHIKDMQGEILGGCIAVQEKPLSAEASLRVSRIMTAARDAVHSAKSTKDIHHNLSECQDSANEALNRFLEKVRGEATTYYLAVVECLRSTSPHAIGDHVDVLRKLARTGYDRTWDAIRDILRSRSVMDTEVASLNSINREILSSSGSLEDALLAAESDPATVADPVRSATG